MQGNTSLKNGDMQTAIKLYTEAIELDPTNHVLYSNRSLALCKARRYEGALQDADKGEHHTLNTPHQNVFVLSHLAA